MGLYVEQVTANRLKSHLYTHMRTNTHTHTHTHRNNYTVCFHLQWCAGFPQFEDS